jgi:hypothetical protein
MYRDEDAFVMTYSVSQGVRLSLVERTLNRLTACERSRSGNVLERQKEEAAVLREAFAEARAELLAAAQAVLDAMAEQPPAANVVRDHALGILAASVSRAVLAKEGR